MDGLGPLWLSLGSLIGLIVLFGRQMTDRHFRDYDDVKRKLSEMTVRMETLEDAKEAQERDFLKLRTELHDTQARALREQAAREQAEKVAETDRLAREQAEREAKALAQLMTEMRASQDTMQNEIDEIKRDREERQKLYEANLAGERQAREQAEKVATELRLTLTTRTEKMQKQIDDLTAEIATLKAKTNGHAETPATALDVTLRLEPPASEENDNERPDDPDADNTDPTAA